jgi:small-conductance mechanosensitive channel
MLSPSLRNRSRPLRRLPAALCALLLVAVLAFAAPPWPGAPLPAATAEESPKTPPAVESGDGCATTPGFITLDGRQVLEIRRAPAAQEVDDYVRRGEKRLRELAEDRTFDPSQIEVREEPPFSIIGVREPDGRFEPELGVDDRAAACFGVTRAQLAKRYRDNLIKAINTYRDTHTLASWLKGTGLAALVLLVYVLLLRGQFALNERFRLRIAARQRFLLQQLSRFGITALVEPDQVRQIMQRFRQVLHWSLVLLVSYLLVPLLLGFFPPTQGIAEGLRGQIRGVVGGFLGGVIAAIPNLLSIGVILAITILVIRLSNAWFNALRLGRIRIPGFYREWAQPTARLVAILASVAGLVSAFPYIPGSGSKVFQGAGLFVGVLAALGSSAVATNLISGLMLIYTRAFREGDRVEINGVVGVVQDRALLVTRLQTPRNELVSIPNATVISSAVVNYTFSRREIRQPVALATTITIGYDVPWKQVHELMLAAARAVPGITDEIEPYVLQTSLNDFHISYELNAFVRDAGTYRQTLSDVLAALQDRFAEAGVEILSPGYHAIRNGNASTVPKETSPPS